MIKIIRENKLLIFLTVLVTLGVLVFNVFHYSTSYGIVEINNVNSLLLVPFILLVCGLGMVLGTTKNTDEIENAYQNQLSEREQQVIELICLGKKNQDIANELFVDITTIKTHINRIYKKTGVKNRRELKFYGKRVLQKSGNQ
ncbi:LuxR C-terminal-related transcriptional regulator [Flagellimonas meridianipacifica]|uniref:Regulatory LuxR family protein n=1 Tax=Flagellimonas meridianipacifica TaxID=1080225 RepID=A0A2T0M902_9FLAO|nr:LuxR C-terminal-related transcriptional regulator [Allomuricauda pacifica]PRX53960.1 regulatory LuxR family protein [Allomuricauda pacifica]